jgi:DNA polymerase III epsilon subunit-like protein
MSLLFLDTETGGLDPQKHELIEVAWAGEDEKIHSLVLPHDPELVDPFAAEVNRYHERGLDDMRNWCSERRAHELSEALEGATLVGANIGFDEAFLTAAGFKGWHYRKLDLEALALGYIGYVKKDGVQRVPGLKDITDALRGYGVQIPEPDHTAAGDVATTIAVYRALADWFSL